MKEETYTNAIKERISTTSPGEIFVTADFSDLAPTNTANRILLRLEEKGTLRKVLRGVYQKPAYSEFLDDFVAPLPEKIAYAIARNHNWTIAPSGDAALNMTGLSTQVPAVWIFLSSGPYKEYAYDRIVIQFKRTAQKDLLKSSKKSAVIVQAIKALGRERITESVMIKIAALLSDQEKIKLLQETQYSTAWIFEIIKKIAGNETKK